VRKSARKAPRAHDAAKAVSSERPVLVKLGGELLENAGYVAALASKLARLARKLPFIIVHGGGREIDSALAKAGIEKRQVDGVRVTDEATLEVVVAVLAGLVNTRFVGALSATGLGAVGLTGADAGIGLVEQASRHVSSTGVTVDLGRVGEPIGRGRPTLLVDLCKHGYVPVIASIGVARNGRLFNVNADTLAAHLASRLRSPRLVIAGATAGVLDRQGATIPDLFYEDLGALVRGGAATAGMIAKLAACRQALHNGVREVFITDGRDLDGLVGLVGEGLRWGGCTQITKVKLPARRRKRVTAVKAS
jgi:acetylglutamate kinase